MSGIIKGILGLLFDKARNAAADKLSEGDLTDESVREVIVREIHDVEKKVDALARKDLISSLHFLKEGLSRLSMALKKKSVNSDSSTASQNVAATPSAAEGLAAEVGASTVQQRLNKVLTMSNIVATKFEVVSPERWKNAKNCFKDSRKAATRAFNNEALSIDDRIIATSLRMVSSILGGFLDDPDLSGKDCLLYLEELHSLPAIREMFSVYVGGGLKSFFNGRERKRKVETIESLNGGLLDFIAGFATKTFCNDVEWPTIRHNYGQYKFHKK